MQKQEEVEATGSQNKEFALVVDGSTLAHILLDEATTGILFFPRNSQKSLSKLSKLSNSF